MRNIQNIFTEDLSFSYKKEIHTKDANSNESVVSQYMANLEFCGKTISLLCP